MGIKKGGERKGAYDRSGCQGFPKPYTLNPTPCFEGPPTTEPPLVALRTLSCQTGRGRQQKPSKEEKSKTARFRV